MFAVVLLVIWTSEGLKVCIYWLNFATLNSVYHTSNGTTLMTSKNTYRTPNQN
jgi:hypothetical protein